MTNTLDILTDVLNSAEKQDYSGYSKFDALNSPLLHFLTFNNKWLRLIYSQAVKESPFHIRPLLGVKKSRNPKGIALFAMAYFILYEKTSNIDYLKKGEALIQWLLDNPSPGCSHLCWGYNFIWQSTRFLQDIAEPNVIVSLFVGEAIVHAYRITQNKKYLDAALSVADFLIKGSALLSIAERIIISLVKKIKSPVLLPNLILWLFRINLRYFAVSFLLFSDTIIRFSFLNFGNNCIRIFLISAGWRNFLKVNYCLCNFSKDRHS